MKIIGLTGGAGSGKSTIARLLATHFPCQVMTMDEIARQQMMPGEISYDAVVNRFGDEILLADGQIDRTKLASLTMADETKRKQLNALTHPNVLEATRTELKRLEKQACPCVIVETALLFDCEFYRECDEIWYVYCPREERKQRLRSSRGYDDARISAVLRAQMTDQSFRKRSTHVIVNRNQTTETQLLKRLRKLMKFT